jgi:ribulose-phosphate 3-epimerase
VIRRLGKKTGAALNPSTPAAILDPVLEELDLILVMSVNPGFGGQKFIDSQLRKIEAIRKKLDAAKLKTILEVDGGIVPENAGAVISAGATALVAGSAVFGKGQANYRSVITALRGARATSTGR